MTGINRWTSHAAGLLVIDIQDRLIGAIDGGERVVWNASRLIRAANLLKIPVWATEQYPRGLGPTVASLAATLPAPLPKTTFHALGAAGLRDSLRDADVAHLTLTGIEAHVCVAQTALELNGIGYRVQVVADAVGSRSTLDFEVALRRLAAEGVTITTTEAVLFEWTERSDRPEFKAISALVKESSPAATS